MQRRNVQDIQTLLSIIVLFALALYVVWPDNPGIHFDLFGNRLDRELRISEGRNPGTRSPAACTASYTAVFERVQPNAVSASETAP